MGKKRLNPECFGEVSHFSGVLPTCHNEVGCHNISQQRRRILSEMKNIVRDLDSIPKCNEWDSSLTSNDTDGPFEFGKFQQRNGKPWDLHRVKSSELVGSQFTPACICLKRNGLQDDCRMQECRGREWCLTEPWPSCPPFTKEPKRWIEPNPLEICPNVPDGKFLPNMQNQYQNGGSGPNYYSQQPFTGGNDGCCYPYCSTNCYMPC